MITTNDTSLLAKRKYNNNFNQDKNNEENSQTKNLSEMYYSLAKSEVLKRFLHSNRKCAVLVLQSAIMAMNGARDCYNPKYPGNLENIKKYNAVHVIDLLEDTLKHNSEMKLIDILDPEMVYFVYFTLFQSRVKLNYLKDFNNICEVWKFESVSSIECDEYTSKEETKEEHTNTQIPCQYFQVNGAIPFIHGSSFVNLYSIYSNDLRSMSGTQLQSNGQAYGPGIYTVPLNEISTACSYCRGQHGCLFILENQSKNVTAYRKSSCNIHVFPSNECFRIKFVLVMKDSYIPASYSTLIEHIKELWTNYYDTSEKNKKYEEQIMNLRKKPHFYDSVNDGRSNQFHGNNNNNNNEIRISKTSVTGQNRLAQELFRFQEKLDTHKIDGVVFHETIDDRLDRWRVGITVNESTALAKDMSKYDISCIIVQFIFDSTQYPFKPPFVFVEKPIFKRMTGHVVDGAVCSSVLSVSDSNTNDQAWSPAYSMDMVVQIIRMLLAEAGEGRIDPMRLNEEYNLHKARLGFQRAMTTHQW